MKKLFLIFLTSFILCSNLFASSKDLLKIFKKDILGGDAKKFYKAEDSLNKEEKILSYSASNKNIDLETIQKLTNLAENYGVNELADSYLAKNTKSVSKILNENNFSEEDCTLILRTILIKIKRLRLLIEKYIQIKNIDEVINSAKPPIFWKDKENVKIQINKWNLLELKNKIYAINEIEMLLKANNKNSLNLLSDFIVNY